LLNKIFSDFQELHGDRLQKNDNTLIGGLAKLNNIPVMVLGQQKGRSTEENIKYNFGMMKPQGYRKALRLMKLADKFDLPIFTFIDTPGAYPGIEAEKQGQSQAIAQNLFYMFKINTSIICTIIGEGCSGGALGIGVGNAILMLEYSYFSTISPEGCASILWKDIKKTKEATRAMCITSKYLKKYNLIDGIIKEPLGGAHYNFKETAISIKNSLITTLSRIEKIKDKKLDRFKKFTSFGIFNEN